MDKIICIGKNYLDHAKELGDAVPTQPLVFFKPPSCLNFGPVIEIPMGKGEVHHELEIVLQLKEDAKGFDKICLGLDLTLRTVQQELKAKGHPWERGKAFPNSAVLTPWINVEEFPEFLDTPFFLKINGVVKQKGIGRDMRWSPSQLLEALRSDFKICEGDLLFTGTPAGVGPLNPGDKLEVGFSNGGHSLHCSGNFEII